MHTELRLPTQVALATLAGTSKDVRLVVKAKNNLILRRMEAQGIQSVRELSERMGAPIRYSKIAELVGMRVKARGLRGEWIPTALRLAAYFKCLPEDLFSPMQQYSTAGRRQAVLEVSSAEVLGAFENRPDDPSPEMISQARELKRACAKVLTTLKPLYRRVLELRFGLNGHSEHTQEEVGEALGKHTSHVQQIEVAAFRILKHPSRSRKIIEVAGNERRKVPYQDNMLNSEVLGALAAVD